MATWLQRWHIDHTPVAIATQATFGYTQNTVVRAFTPDAPPIDAIVEELFPIEAVSDLHAFFGAADDADLGDRMGQDGGQRRAVRRGPQYRHGADQPLRAVGADPYAATVTLLIADENRVRTLTLNRPEALNAFSEALYDATDRGAAGGGRGPRRVGGAADRRRARLQRGQ